MSLRELIKRLTVAALGIPLALGLLYVGGWPLAVTLALIAALAVREFYRLGQSMGIKPFYWVGLGATVVLVLLAGAHRSYEAFAPEALTLFLGLFFFCATASVWLRWPDGRPLFSVPLTMAGVVYAGGGVCFAVFLRHLPETPYGLRSELPLQGPALLAFPLAVTWTADTAAYFFGYLFGNRKLIPSVSPGKTVVGGVAGLAAATLTGALVAWLAVGLHPDPTISALLGGGMGLALGAAAQMGDLVESVLKREAGVKDSGTMLPGHGGVLDRFDALLFTLPLSYVLVRLVGALQ